ncbi:hypothetical protein Ga0080574_TMP3748 [Salipiger abyssi]|uniref:Uncharacterized protein n=1 Tax=Salipiger abyssi TaxID=1250539 RepID=A0A1P8UXF7_9RHOB|nr:hypothetical protein Ga0080574_TMP3748 [Salipiger abyssi]
MGRVISPEGHGGAAPPPPARRLPRDISGQWKHAGRVRASGCGA